MFSLVKTREWMAEKLKDKRLPDGEKSIRYSQLAGKQDKAAPGQKVLVCPEPDCGGRAIWIGVGLECKCSECGKEIVPDPNT